MSMRSYVTQAISVNCKLTVVTCVKLRTTSIHGRLKMEEKKLLNKHQDEICSKVVDIGGIVSILISCGILTKKDELDINEQGTEYDRASRILDLIKLSPTWPNAYYEFLKALEKTGNDKLRACLEPAALGNPKEIASIPIQKEDKSLKIFQHDFEKALKEIDNDLEEIHLSEVTAKVKHLVKVFEFCSMLKKIVFHNVKLEGSFSQKMDLCNLQEFEYLDNEDASGIRAVDQSGKLNILKQIMFFLRDEKVEGISNQGIKMNITIAGQTYLLIDSRAPNNNINPFKVPPSGEVGAKGRRPIKLSLTTRTRSMSEIQDLSADYYVQVDDKKMTKSMFQAFLLDRRTLGVSDVKKLAFMHVIPYWSFIGWLCEHKFPILEEIHADISIGMGISAPTDTNSWITRLPQLRVYNVCIHNDAPLKVMDEWQLKSLLLMNNGNPLDLHFGNIWKHNVEVNLKAHVNINKTNIMKISRDELVLAWIAPDVTAEILSHVPSTVTSVYLNELGKLPVGFNQNSVKHLKQFGLRWVTTGDICNLTRTAANLTTLQLYNAITNDSLVDFASLAESSPKLHTISINHARVKFLERGRLEHLKNLHLYHCYGYNKRELPRNLAKHYPKLSKFTYDGSEPRPNIHLLSELCQVEAKFIALWRVDWDVKPDNDYEEEIQKQLREAIPKEDPNMEPSKRRSTNIILEKDDDGNHSLQLKVWNDWLPLEYEQFSFDKVFSNNQSEDIPKPRPRIQMANDPLTTGNSPNICPTVTMVRSCVLGANLEGRPEASAELLWRTKYPSNALAGDFQLNSISQLKAIATIIEKDGVALRKWISTVDDFVRNPADVLRISKMIADGAHTGYVLETLKCWKNQNKTTEVTFDICIQKLEKQDFQYICDILRQERNGIMGLGPHVD